MKKNNKMPKIIISLLLASTLSSNLFAQDIKFGPKKESQGNRLDDIIVLVGNDVITRREVAGSKNPKALINNLITRKLLLQEAKRRNIVISDSALNRAIKSKKVRNYGKSKNARQTAKEELMIARLQQGIVASLVDISENEIDNIVNRNLQQVAQQVNLVDILIKVPKNANQETLDKAQQKTQDILEQLKTQSAQSVAGKYKNVFYNRLGWVEISQIPPNFAKGLIDTQENSYAKPIIDRDGIHILKVLAKKGKARPMAQLKTKTSHILIKGSSPESKKLIFKISKMLKNGDNFAELARNYSEDTTANKGGDLGFVQRGKMVPEFENMMNKTKEGRYSKPFKTQFGWHILKVVKRKREKVDTNVILRSQAKNAIYNKKAGQEWELWLSRLREESFVEFKK